MAVVLVGLLACSSTDGSGSVGVPRKALLALARFDSANPSSPATFVFKKNELKTFPIRHTDASQSLFAEFTFTPSSVLSRNDTILADTSTVVVTVSIAPGSYEFVLGPATLGFNIAGEPVVTLYYPRYGNLAVFDSSPQYASAAAFEQALALWYERAPDAWVRTRNSAHPGASQVASALSAPGHYLIAAPK